MGACTFGTIGFGKNIKDAYNNAVNAALYEHGHDSYNGTISTTSLVADVTSKYPRYGTKAFSKALNQWFDKTDSKWECYGVEIKGKVLKDWRKREGMQRRKGKAYYFFGWAGC